MTLVPIDREIKERSMRGANAALDAAGPRCHGVVVLYYWDEAFATVGAGVNQGVPPADCLAVMAADAPYKIEEWAEAIRAKYKDALPKIVHLPSAGENTGSN